MSKPKLTPMLQQYFSLKEKHPTEFLFFRLGDFYEMFGEDAKEGARLLGLTLTARQKGTPNEIAMCGVPHHSAEKYIAQLTKLGKRVALCEQTSDPNEPGIVERDVVQIITPSTTLDESVVDTSKPNYLLSLFQGKTGVGISLLDLATAEFKVAQIRDASQLKSLIYMLDPAEIICPDSEQFGDIESNAYQIPNFESSDKLLSEHFGVKSLSGYGIEKMELAIEAAAAALSYAKEMQKTDLVHLTKLSIFHFEEHMLLDESTIRNLELLQTSRDGSREGSLIGVIDRTLTKMGARKLREWMLHPLQKQEDIERRLEAVSDLLQETEARSELQQELKQCYDLERLVGRIGCRRANARDLVYLENNLLKVPVLKQCINGLDSKLLKTLHSQLDEITELKDLITTTLLEDPSVKLTEGNMIADGYNSELDELRDVLKNGKQWLLDYQQQLRDQTGISTLKVKYNKVFNYYIEVSKAQQDKMPAEFEIKQTLVNAQRYISQELKDFEGKYLSAEERIATLEYELFQELVEQVIPYMERVQINASLIANLDVLQGFAQLANDQHFSKPSINSEQVLEIKEGRHPVIEVMLRQEHKTYIANDCSLAPEKRVMVLTGPNMAGKSSYLRQTALIVLLAHMGSFVPAKSAQIPLTDRIFTRVGASDDLSRGQSTFMVEMSEAANIINNASERSLIIFDELGRGTSTYDGVSIAWAVLEFVARELKAFTLFATHYHELIQVAEEIPEAMNFSVAVSEKDGEVVFLHKVVEGGVNRSYGIEVAQLAGLPNQITDRAKIILEELEKDRLVEEQHLMGIQPDLFSYQPQQMEPSPHRKIIDDLKQIDPNQMTPMQALEYLQQLKQDL